MGLRIHYLQHVPYEGPAYLNNWAQYNHHQISGTQLYKHNKLPALANFDVLIVLGGPMGANDEQTYPWLATEKVLIKQALNAGKKVIGICLGAQLLAQALGASVHANPQKEIGWFMVTKSTDAPTPLTATLPATMQVFHWHADTFELPTGATNLFSSEACANQGFVKDNALGLQFHLECTKASVKDLIANGADQLTHGDYIQPPTDMLNVNAKQYQNANMWLCEMLNFFLALPNSTASPRLAP